MKPRRAAASALAVLALYSVAALGALAPRLALRPTRSREELCEARRCTVAGEARVDGALLAVVHSAQPRRFLGGPSDRFHLVLEREGRRWSAQVGAQATVCGDGEGPHALYQFQLLELSAAELGGLPVARLRFRDHAQSAGVGVYYCSVDARAPACVGPVEDVAPRVTGRGRAEVGASELRLP